MALPPQEIKKYDFIDALRGFAILGVILIHSSYSVLPTNPTLQKLMLEGARGVQLFFIVSSFTLCMSWASRSNNETFPIRDFFIRRFFRIAPMFYLAIFLYIFINGLSPAYWAPNGIKWWFILTTALFLHGFHPETITSVVPGGWSIAVEMSFYLVLPFLLPLIKSIKSCLIFFILSLALYTLNSIIIPYLFVYPENQQHLVQEFTFLNFLSQFPVFIIGIFTYLIFKENFPRRRIAIGGCLLLLILAPLFWYQPYMHHTIAGGLFSVFALLLANWPTRLLVNRVTTTLGKLSFSMYLVHFAVLTCFARLGVNNFFPKGNTSSFLHFLCIIFVSAFVSLFSYKCIELPGIAQGKRLIKMLEQDTAPTPNLALNPGDTQ